MAETRRINRVHRTLSRPLTILGAERKLFFFAMCLGAATFNLLNSLFGGLLIFLLLYFLARWATQTDPQILRFLLTAARLRAQYDPMKFSPDSNPKGWPCSDLAESSRITTRPALSVSRSISTASSVRTFFSPRAGRSASSSKFAASITSVSTTLRLTVSRSGLNRR